jgi:hypothetical protein
VWFSSGCLHECFPCHETTFFMSRIIHAFLTHSANPTFRGWKVFAHFCPIPQHWHVGARVTWCPCHKIHPRKTLDGQI